MKPSRFPRAALAAMVALALGGSAAPIRPAHAAELTVTTTIDNVN